jgi:hypothetical protein
VGKGNDHDFLSPPGLSRSASYCVSNYLAPRVTAFQPLSGLCFFFILPQVSPGAIISLRPPRFHLGLFKFNPYRGCVFFLPIPQVSLGAIQIQPLSGLCFFFIYPRFHLGLFKLSRSARYCVSTPIGVVCVFSSFPRFHLGLFKLSRSARYCVSTPIGVGTSGAHFPQVAPVAIHIISLRSLLRFNPFGVVCVFFHRPPGFTWGYSYYLAPLVTAFQPLWGCVCFFHRPPGFTHFLNS